MLINLNPIKTMKPSKIKDVVACLFCSILFVKGYCQTDTLAVQVDTLAVDTVPKVAISIESAPIPSGKQPVYKLKPAVDIPLSLATAGWSLYAFTKIYSKDDSSPEEIQSLRVSDINRFDRWAADVYSEKAADVSDFLF
jgi:hypothetical protein